MTFMPFLTFIFGIFFLLSFSTVFGESLKEENERIPLVCHYGTWALYRQGIGNFSVENIDPDLCTHLVYSFVGLKQFFETFEVLCVDPWLDLNEEDGNDDCKQDFSYSNYYGTLRNLVALKEKNPKLKIILGIGGWDKLMTKRFSLMARTPYSRNRFIISIINFINRFNFDGVDIDWQFPTDICQDLPGDCETEPNNDRETMIIFLQALKAQLHDKYLSVAISSTIMYIWGSIEFRYNIKAISETVDHIYIMAYQYYMFGEWDTRIMHHSPLYSTNDYEESIDLTVKYLLSTGASPQKLILGIATNGVTYYMANENHTIGYSQALGPGRHFEWTQTMGEISYLEIANEFKKYPFLWTRVFDEKRKASYAYNLQDRTWIGYDSEWSIMEKIEYAIKENGLGGIMVYSLENDDFHNLSGSFYNFPMTGFIKDRLKTYEK